MKWWQEAVVYQIYPRSFQDSDGDGIGDLQGIIDKLDYLNDGTPNSLGVDAIWISPIYPSPMFDFGYDISDYNAIDPVFGSMADFQRLLDQAHQRGIRIIMDLVINHTSHQHPWFIESRSSRDNPKRDWYIWKDPVLVRENNNNKQVVRKPPNNWVDMFDGSVLQKDAGDGAWAWDELTQQYYLHSFLKEQPDLNWRNPQVQEAVFHMVRGWLDMGVDGFRLDVINYIFKDDEFRDNPFHNFKIGRVYDRMKHVYDRDRQPELRTMLSDLRTLLDSYPGHRTSVGEIQVEDHTKVQHVASCVGGNDQLHMAFNFAYFFTPWDAAVFRKRIEEWDTACRQVPPLFGWPTYTLSNHDYPRHISRYAPRSLWNTLSKNLWSFWKHQNGSRRGQKRSSENNNGMNWWMDSAQEQTTLARAKIAALMLLTLRGTPFLYYGEEIGMREEEVPHVEMQDPVGIRHWPFHPGRDGCRRPMAWTGHADQNWGGFLAADATFSAKGDAITMNGMNGHTPTNGHHHSHSPGEHNQQQKENGVSHIAPYPWLPLSDYLETINVASQEEDPSSMLSFYKKVIWFRRRDEVLRRGTQDMIRGLDDLDDASAEDTTTATTRAENSNRKTNNPNESSPKGTVAYVREYKSARRLVLLNFTGRRATMPLLRAGIFADAAGFQVLLSTHEDRACAATAPRNDTDGVDPSLIKGSKIVLKPNEGVILRVWSKQSWKR